MSRQAKSLSELQFYVNLLEDFNDKKKYTDYNLLQKDLLIEFGIKTTRSELVELFEPTVEEMVKDIQIQLMNVC